MEYDYAIHLESFSAVESSDWEFEANRYMIQLKPYLPNNKNSRILEIGPGYGLTMKALSNAGYTSVEGIEVDSRLAEIARGQGVNVKQVTEDEVIPYLEGQIEQYDLVYCMHVIEHIPVDMQLLFVLAISKSLKSNGFFVCETPNALGVISSYFRNIDWTHRIIFSPKSLEFLLKNSRLEVVVVGAALEIRRPPEGNIITAPLKLIAARFLLFLSRGLQRFHFVAEFGAKVGFALPVTPSIMAVGRKST